MLNGTGYRTRVCHYLMKSKVPSRPDQSEECQNETCECVKGLLYDGSKCTHIKNCWCWLEEKGGVLKAGETFKKDCMIYQCVSNNIVRKDLAKDCPPIGSCTTPLVKDEENECCFVSATFIFSVFIVAFVGSVA